MSNISSWTEAILLTLAVLGILTIIMASMNVTYNKNYDTGIVDTSGAENAFIDYQSTAESQIEGGEVTYSAQEGITLKSSYGMTKAAMRVVWSFVSGGFIENVVTNWNVGEGGVVLARVIRVLWFLSIVFALLYALFKIKV